MKNVKLTFANGCIRKTIVDGTNREIYTYFLNSSFETISKNMSKEFSICTVCEIEDKIYTVNDLK